MMTNRKLPPAFADLTPFMDWALPTESQRLKKREESTMDEISAFYAAAQPRAAAVLDHFRATDQKMSKDQAEIDVETQNLFTLMLALSEVSLSTEIHRSSTVPDGMAWDVWKPEHETPAWKHKPKVHLFPAG
tara:strand:- start:16 stop:411 length:396 start_codon:yes stop_codon:yes gene_type:complete